MESNSAPQPNPKRRIVVSLALIALYAALTGLAFWEQSTSWPHDGSWAFLVYIFLCPGIVFQTFVVVYTGLTGRVLTRRVLTRLLTIPVGLAIAANLEKSGSNLATSDFERAYAPFVAQIGANLGDPCAGAAKYFAIPAVAAYNKGIHSRPRAELHYDGKRFVVSFLIGSIDMDGGKIYFDSGAKSWRKFHNNIETDAEAFKKLTEGLASCTLNSEPALKAG